MCLKIQVCTLKIKVSLMVEDDPTHLSLPSILEQPCTLRHNYTYVMYVMQLRAPSDLNLHSAESYSASVLDSILHKL